MGTNEDPWAPRAESVGLPCSWELASPGSGQVELVPLAWAPHWGPRDPRRTLETPGHQLLSQSFNSTRHSQACEPHGLLLGFPSVSQAPKALG